MRNTFHLGARNVIKILVSVLIVVTASLTAAAQIVFIRIDQVGYLPSDKKIAIAFSESPIDGRFLVRTARSKVVAFTGSVRAVPKPDWGGTFPYYYELDLSALQTRGRYFVELPRSKADSSTFSIDDYAPYQEDLLFFMRQQRCGYNPYLDTVCHIHDGRSFYGPLPDGTFVDASGGWHDAGDQLKYLITASNATARMLVAFELEKKKFSDTVDDLGRPSPNGIPDILDEAKWGLDWIFKLHPAPALLYHQVADDRDHRGFKLPDQDNADYGWGANSYRPVYFADGKPQGLGQYKSRSTGVANIAGRSAAAMAIAYRIWKNDLRDPIYAEKCLRAAIELYAMGQRQEGFQQGNSFGAPYRYNEDTWTDDMEWAAAELFKATRKPKYLLDAKRYAKLAGSTSWMEYDNSDMGENMSRHYERYPFTNVGHFALYPLVDAKTKKELVEYYRSGIEKIIARGKANPYGVGVPFLWCSNNLVVAFITQVMFYEKMTGDMKYHDALVAHRDWLLGRNPWGTSMFSGIPSGGRSPTDTHLPTVQILKIPVRGALVDGPIAAATYKGLRGLTLTKPDALARFQPDTVIYHDDVGDYSTNEPTMDGTADAILIMAAWSGLPQKAGPSKKPLPYTIDHGAVIRGDKDRRKIALVFTGDEFAEGADTIIKTLEKRGVKASFFLTGRFYRDPQFKTAIEKLKTDGNYLGPHSDGHLLYADWNDRSKTLVIMDKFTADLNKNYEAMAVFGIKKADARYFLPPYEWYNDEVAGWASQIGLKLINFTPGTRSNADYMIDTDKHYVSNDAIFDSIKAYESKDTNGLNGFILLTHIGAGPQRTEKFFERLDPLIVWLRSKNYEMVRIDELLH